jgi:hypothetical protein
MTELLYRKSCAIAAKKLFFLSSLSMRDCCLLKSRLLSIRFMTPARRPLRLPARLRAAHASGGQQPTLLDEGPAAACRAATAGRGRRPGSKALLGAHRRVAVGEDGPARRLPSRPLLLPLPRCDSEKLGPRTLGSESSWQAELGPSRHCGAQSDSLANHH